MFQNSIDTGTGPNRWKNANVCGVFKKAKRSDRTNYRQISLTCVACKILEHIIHSHVTKHFERYDILTDHQHGFRSVRNTELQLILTIHDMAKAIQLKNSVHAAVLDFTKAFDKVPHQRLLKKLEYYGIHGTLLDEILSYWALPNGSLRRKVIPSFSRHFHREQFWPPTVFDLFKRPTR